MKSFYAHIRTITSKMAANEIFQDAQTTITGGLVGAVGGEISSKAAIYIGTQIGLAKMVGVGGKAARFVVAALTSSAIYYAVARIAPDTTSNTFFAYTYFLANRTLTSETLQIAGDIVSFVDGESARVTQKQKSPVFAPPQAAAARSHCSSC